VVSHAIGKWPARLRLDPTAYVAPGAIVVGAVTLGPRASVWFNTVVRGDTAPIEIGEGSNVQDNSTVHVDEGQPAILGARVTVGHRSIVHGCVIEDDCLIGMGSIVLSGARIGRGSLIGAGALVKEGQQIPPGSLAVGAPARVVGPVAEAHREAIERGASHYAELARSYLERGFARPHPFASSDLGISARSGPMTFHEWGELLGALAEAPDWAADRLESNAEDAWRRAPGAGRWSALEVLCHLRDADVDVYLPRLERLLASEAPQPIADVDMTGWETSRRYADQSPAAVLDAWTAARRRLIAALAPLPRAAWSRFGFHSVRGPYPLGEMVRYWVEHDLSHRRQIAEALGEFA
jgi:carbonic anhydrase/acetyltransferase-like protein (isoleucine patch superfamily)